MPKYAPDPIDTTAISLPSELDILFEKLAESTHDHWALQRISDGWTWGEKRDDAAKTHPCLVAYADLPESEKQYDRRTAIETLKAVLALGFVIKREYE